MVIHNLKVVIQWTHYAKNLHQSQTGKYMPALAGRTSLKQNSALWWPWAI